MPERAKSRKRTRRISLSSSIEDGAKSSLEPSSEFTSRTSNYSFSRQLLTRFQPPLPVIAPHLVAPPAAARLALSRARTFCHCEVSEEPPRHTVTTPGEQRKMTRRFFAIALPVTAAVLCSLQMAAAQTPLPHVRPTPDQRKFNSTGPAGGALETRWQKQPSSPFLITSTLFLLFLFLLFFFSGRCRHRELHLAHERS